MMTLYGSVGVQQRAEALMATVQSSRITAVAKASQPSNRQSEYATLLTNVFFLSRTDDYFSSYLLS